MKHVYFIISSLLLAACSSSQPEQKELPPKVPLEEKERKSQSLRIEFQNNGGKIIYEVDPTDEDLFIDFKGSRLPKIQENKQEEEKTSNNEPPKQKKVSEPEPWAPTNTEVDSLFQKEVKKQDSAPADTIKKDVLGSLSKAREAFYKKDYRGAIAAAEQSLTFQETAEAYALLGSIHYTQKRRKKAIENWKRALEIDPDLQSVKDVLQKLEGAQP